MLQELHFNLLASECILSARTTLTAEKQQFVDGELSLVKNSQELLPYGATSANNCYSHGLVQNLYIRNPKLKLAAKVQ
jgi:hypothetical protein